MVNRFHPLFTRSQKKLFFVLESDKIMADWVDIGMSRTLGYFQSSVTPMELRLPNFSKVNSSGWVVEVEERKLKSATSDPT